MGFESLGAKRHVFIPVKNAAHVVLVWLESVLQPRILKNDQKSLFSNCQMTKTSPVCTIVVAFEVFPHALICDQ